MEQCCFPQESGGGWRKATGWGHCFDFPSCFNSCLGERKGIQPIINLFHFGWSRFTWKTAVKRQSNTINHFSSIKALKKSRQKGDKTAVLRRITFWSHPVCNRKPHQYLNLKLPHKLPPKREPMAVNSLPMLGYLEQTVAVSITKAMTAVGTVKPKYPFLSASKSALIYVAFHLKGKHLPCLHRVDVFRGLPKFPWKWCLVRFHCSEPYLAKLHMWYVKFALRALTLLVR